jgi:pyruvate formate lyase activating enzyme
VGIVSKVLRWSAVDGPGNRLVLFLQGCNFDCPGCHNPHTIGLCNDCGICVPVCPPRSLTMVDGRIAFDPSTCTQCDECLRACPIKANPMVQQLTVDQVLELLRRDLAFLNGITVSGGEATMQLKFVRALFEAVKASPDLRHLTCFIDSNGYLGPASWSRLLDVTDGVMLDIKAFDPARHRALTGQDNARSLASARLLAAAGKLYELRFLMVPGQTDRPEELAALRDFVQGLGPGIRLRLNAFQHHGVRGPARDWPAMPRSGVEAAVTALVEAGLGPVAVPSVWLG